MKVSASTKRYFDKLGRRLTDYADSIEVAHKYVSDNLKNKKNNQDIVLKLLIGSILWTAAKRNEEMSENEVFLFLGLEEQEESYNTPIRTEKKIRNMPLEEFLASIMFQA